MATGRGAAFAVAAGTLGAICIAPLIVLLAAPVWTGRWDAYGSAILDARQVGLLLNSLRIAGAAAAAATAIGAPLGFLLARTPIPARNAVRLALALPVVVPTYALALSWIFMTVGEGIGPRLLGSGALAGTTYSPAGAIIVLALALYPVPMLATEAATRRIELRLEEAALLVAPMPRVLARVTFPLLVPAIASSGLLTFVLALSDYSVPNLLRQRVFTTEVFTAFAALYDTARATALAIPLVAVALAAGYLVASSDARVLEVNRVSQTAGVSRARFDAATCAAIAIVLVVSVVLPLGTLALETRNVAALRQAIERSGAAIAETLILAGLAATLAAGVSLVLGHRRARSNHRFVHLADAGLLALFAVPGTITGVALIELWNRPGWSGVVYGSSAIVVIAYLARFIPVATLIVSAGIRRVSRTTEDAAALSGAGWVRTMRHIVFPQIASSLAVAWVLVFVLAFGEVAASVLVAPAGHAPYPVHVFTLIANARTEQVAALALVQALVVVCPFAIAIAYSSWCGARRG
jgi:iron(III) transport system permease protein